MRKSIFILLILQSILGQAQLDCKFRIWLKDKNGSPYSLNKPNEFLSTKALARRSRQNIPLDSTDIPVSPIYLSQLSGMGLQVITTSRWMNTAVVALTDSSLMIGVRKLPFVKSAELVWEAQPAPIKSPKLRNETSSAESLIASGNGEYGSALPQLSISNGNKLHQAGFKGEGMTIAIIDAGFLHADTISAYKHTKILGAKDFVNPAINVYSGDKHGQSVLSVMAAVDSFRYIGSAPKASYWLLRSEDNDSEFPIEEDYWTAAAEFADSVGVDLINTSLGYAVFDNSKLDHTHAQLDGKTIFVSKAAQMATDKGIFVVVSAGNEGNKSWQKINAPSDAKDVLAVGAININLQIAAFSSLGFSADNRVKPDVVSVGEGTYLLDPLGNIIASNGTSFSAPLMTGMVACLWQGLPNFTNKQLIDLIRSQSNFYTQPDVRYGYGVPDLWMAWITATNQIANHELEKPEIFFNSKRGNSLSIRNLPSKDSLYTIRIYTETGRLVLTDKMDSKEHACDTRNLRRGLHIVYIESQNYRYAKKIIK